MMTIDRQLEDAIRVLIDDRDTGTLVCPSEAARRVGGTRWRSLVAPARRAAHRMVEAGEVEICIRGEVIDPSASPSGPIRVRKPQ